MHTNLKNFTKLQLSSLGRVLHLQVLCILLFPAFFTRLNEGKDLQNTIIYSSGLFILSYLLLRNFAFQDEKYKTKLFFGLLPITPKTVLSSRTFIVYLGALLATPVIFLSSLVFSTINPSLFLPLDLRLIPMGFLIFMLLMPVHLLIFNFFEAQKADIIGALIMFPFMGISALCCYFLGTFPKTLVLIACVILSNFFLYIAAAHCYKERR